MLPSSETNEGWLANLIYLGSVGLAGLVAWVHQYRHGRSKPDDQHRTVVLESADLADMRPMRQVAAELARIKDQLQNTYAVVQANNRIVDENHRIVEDNHRIVEQNREMLLILQKLDRAFAVEEEVKEKLREQQIEAILKAARQP